MSQTRKAARAPLLSGYSPPTAQLPARMSQGMRDSQMGSAHFRD